MPFDLGGTRRWPIKYSLDEKQDKTQVKDGLVAKLKLALGEISRQSINLGKLVPCGKAHLAIRENYYLGMGGSPSSSGRGQNKEGVDLYVGNFQGALYNTSNEPIRSVTGYILVRGKTDKYPLMLNDSGTLVGSSELKCLSPGEELLFGVPFSNEPSRTRIEPQEFLDQFTPFSLFIRVDDDECRYDFARSDVSALIQKWWDQYYRSKELERRPTWKG